MELTSPELRRASSVQSQRAEQLLKLKGVQGVGIAASSDRPGEAALTIFVIRGSLHDSIPAVLDGVRTQVRESSRFHLGSGSMSSRSRSCNASVKSQSGEYGQKVNHEEQYIHSHRLDESLPYNAQK